jgi:hypothetical protein
MSIVRTRSGVGILVSIILMFSIVMFVSSLFWIITDSGFLFGAPESSLFKPATAANDIPTKPNNNTESLNEKHEIVKNLSLEEALSDLISDGCRIVNVKSIVYLDNPQIVSYKEFKLKALESQIVVASPSDSGTFLLVQIESIQWVWIPS